MENDSIQGDERGTYVALDTSTVQGMRDGPPRREAQGHGVLIVVVGVTSHQGAEESSAQGEGAQVFAAEGRGGVRDARSQTRVDANRFGGGRTLERRILRKAYVRCGEGPTEKGW